MAHRFDQEEGRLILGAQTMSVAEGDCPGGVE